MLVASPRHTPEDLVAWESAERGDAAWSRLRAHLDRFPRALVDAAQFAAEGPCYAGTSWGKDSTVLAHLIAELGASGAYVPLVWVRAAGVENPDCFLVRDAFLAAHEVDYHEITVPGDPAKPTGRLEVGFAEASRRFGGRYLSGVRGDEHRGRARRMYRWGVASPSTCAPLGWWKAEDVFAHLYAHRLPVHPAYAMTMGGLLDRRRIRVATLGGERGTGWGRREWEERCYSDMSFP